MGKHLTICDDSTGEVLEDIKFTGGYNIQWTHLDDYGAIQHVTTLHNAKWGDNFWIKNYMYTPITKKLIEKFEELRHINPDEILFLEDSKYTPKSAKNIWKARVKKAAKQLTEFTGYRFIIETRKYFTEKMTQEQILVLIYHELRHIDSDGSIQKHDIEDWNNIIATFGVGWDVAKKEIKDILSDNFEDWDMLLKTEKQLSLYDNQE